jgi:hypothetical protein
VEVPRPASDAYRHTAQSPYIAKPEGVSGSYRKMTISPKTLPDPLLRYRVNTFATEKETGNAFPLFLSALREFNRQTDRAVMDVYRSEAYRKLDPTDEEERNEMNRLEFKAFPLYNHWGAEMHTEITAEEENQFYQRLDGVYQLLEKASKKTYFDWSDAYEYKGIYTDLVHIQDARALTRYLAGKANWEIRNGNYADATRTIRVGLALADHVLESRPSGFLVGMLVGIACKGVMYHELHLLSAQPDAPNLYPALMQLTTSQRIWLDAIQSETLLLLSKYSDDTFWDTLDSISAEQAKTILDDFYALFFTAMSNEANENALPLARAMVCTALYPPAKQRLLQKGLSEEAIEALSTYQIVVPFALEEIKRAYDLMVVNASMPMGETPSAFKFDEYVMNLTKNPRSPVDSLLALLTPATSAAQTAFHRSEQTLDLLKIVEAIRYSAAIHGKLPASLEEITELAVPKMCSITAKPYEYRVSGNTAVIDYSMYGRVTSRIEIVLE